MKAKLTRSALFGVLRNNLRAATDPRNQQAPNFRYPVEQAGMSAFGAFYLQHESLAAHEKALQRVNYSHNFKKLFHESPIENSNTVRNILDPIDPQHLSEVFSNVLKRLDRSAMLPSLRYSSQIGLLVAADGVDYYSSQQVACTNCSKAVHKKGTEEQYTCYSHKMLNVGLVHPIQNMFIPLAPEFITPQDGHSKQDCEQEAAKRWIKKFRSVHRQLRCTMQFDSLHSKHDFLSQLKQHRIHFISACKPGSHKTLFEWVDTARKGNDLSVVEERIRVGGRYIHRRYEFLSNAPIRDTEDALRVQWVQLTETDPKKRKPAVFTYVTDHKVTKKNVAQIAAGGRKRWKVENEGHNALKNQGYYFDHNYGHGKKNLSANIATLILFSFLIHNLLRLIDQDGLATLYKQNTRKGCISLLRHTLFVLKIGSWEELYQVNLECYDSS